MTDPTMAQIVTKFGVKPARAMPFIAGLRRF